MKRRIISYILIGSLSAMCLCGCGGKKADSGKEETIANENAESSNEETEDVRSSESSDEETEDVRSSESSDEETEGEGSSESSMVEREAGSADAGLDENAEGTGNETGAGQDDGNTDSGGTSENTDSNETFQNTGTGTADSDALDASWGVITQYGFNDKNESNLSFGLKGSTLIDCGSFYTIKATFYKPILVSLDHKAGDIVEIVTNELTGEKSVLTYKGAGAFVDADNIDYYAIDPSSAEPVELYYFSDDRVEAAFYEGIISIAADAESCTAISGEKTTVDMEMLSEDNWYNGIAFNSKNQAATLTYYGD